VKEYEGNWKDDQRHGFGIEFDDDGSILKKGEWKEGEFIGNKK
jgi:antitoxin component YwqK of YwqJK toxin-antitoxin module